MIIGLLLKLIGRAIDDDGPVAISREAITCVIVLEINPADGYAIGLGPGEQVVLREGVKEDTVIVLARGTSTQYIELGILYDEVIYENVVNKRARGKITDVHNGLVTIRFDW